MELEIITEKLRLIVPGSASDMGAYLASPAAPGKYSAIILGMELFGVTDHICDIARRVAKLGYLAIAPDFYHRTLPDFPLPYTEEGRRKGFESLHQLDRGGVKADAQSAIDHIRSRPEASGKVGFMGFSMGGHLAYYSATQLDLVATVSFYGGWLLNTDIKLSQPEPTITLTSGIAGYGGKILYFAGDKDPHIPPQDVKKIKEALEAAGVGHEIVSYPDASHGFFCDARPDNYNEAVRDDAWLRVQRFFAGAF
ncbi:dienelactone hydrolase family protein [Flavitalea flava]